MEKFIMGVNINSKYQDFVAEIMSLAKTVETRNKPTLRCYLGKRVGIVRTGCDKAMLYGYATITEEIHYDSVGKFRADYRRHLVEEGSRFDIVKEKYGYVLSDVEVLEQPVPVATKGIIARKIYI